MASIFPIITIPDPVLRTEAAPVERVDDALRGVPVEPTHDPFDRPVALADELEADVAGQHLPIELDDFSHTLREFRAQVNERLGDDDVETRYDLGIAYREMGLLAEAIAELQLASRSERRLVECVSLLAACFVDKGLPRLAVQWLERGLAAPGLGAPQAMSLRYDLAAVLAASGEGERARDLFTEIYGEDAGFRDVAERLRALRAGGSEDEGRGVVLPWRKR